MLSREERGGWEGGGDGGGGDFDILSKIFVKNRHSPGQRILSKNTKIPTQGQGSYVKCSYPEAMLFILGIHHNQTRQKMCTSLSLRKTEIILPINSTKSNSHKY